MKKINFINRCAIQAVFCIVMMWWLDAAFYYEAAESFLLVALIAAVLQLVTEVVRFFRTFKISKKGE